MCVLGMHWFESVCICFLKQARRLKRPRTAKTEACNSLMHIFELTVTVLHSHQPAWIYSTSLEAMPLLPRMYCISKLVGANAAMASAKELLG